MFVLALQIILIFQLALAEQPNVTFIAIGDWGDTLLPGQEQVADQMDIWSQRHNTQFILSVGDNFYPNGVRSVDDRQFDNKWRYVYNHSSLENLDWYLTVGNHDYGRDNGEEWNQVEFSYFEPRWIFPHLWHSFYMDIEGTDSTIHFIAIDSECLGREVNNHTVMLEWLEDELANSVGDWVIVFGHRNIYSVGDYGPWSGRMDEEIRPLLEQYGTHMYFCGHDHNMQLLHHENGTGMEYIVTGGGGALWYLYDEEAADTLYRERGVVADVFQRTWGFVGVVITENELYLEYIDNEGNLFHTFTREKWLRKN